jgi:hypothetical protein
VKQQEGKEFSVSDATIEPMLDQGGGWVVPIKASLLWSRATSKDFYDRISDR